MLHIFGKKVDRPPSYLNVIKLIPNGPGVFPEEEEETEILR
jgi:hypothetical protein